MPPWHSLRLEAQLSAMTEEQLQRQICLLLERCALPGVEWFAIYNNPRNAIDGARQKKKGMKAGVFDLQLIYRGAPFFLELKTEKGRASEAQLAFRDRMLNQGVPAIICKGYEQAYRVLKFTWGLIR